LDRGGTVLIVKSEGLVLRKIPYKDNAVVVHILTREFGKLGFLVRGLNGKKGTASLYQPGMLLNLVFYNSPRNGLCTVKDASAITRVQLSPVAGMLQQLMIEMVIKSVPDEYADPAVFDLLKESFVALPHAKLTYFLHRFAIHFSQEMGCAIPLVAHHKSAVVAAYEGMIMQTVGNKFLPADIVAIEKIEQGFDPELSRQQRGLLLNKLMTYFSLHVSQGKEIVGLRVLEQLL
jgi:DNA repair protein RecO (recombination protein O)